MAYDRTRAVTRLGPAPNKWTVGDVIARGDKCFGRMENALTYWQTIAELFYPERADFHGQQYQGDERYWDIFDEEAMLLRRNLANRLGAMIRPRGRDWFFTKAKPRQLNKVEAVKLWCEGATETLRDVIYAPTTNFTKAFSESDNDYVAFGTSVLTHTYNRDRTGLLFTCLHPRDCAYGINADGVIDEMHERMRKSLRQLDEMGFVIPKEWVKRFQDDPNQEVEVRRCVYPIERYMENEGAARMPRDAKFAVMYTAVEHRVELKSKSGSQPFFRTWPYLVRRWMTVSGELWGRSPCTSVALATTRMANQAGLSIIESLEKLVNPPLVAPDDSFSEGVQIRANGISYYDAAMLKDLGARDPVTALPVGRPDFGMEYQDRIHAFQARAFLQDLIRFPQPDKEMTAYEASKLFDEYIQDAAPVFEPLEAENGQVMEGVFERAYEADGPGKSGAFDEPPEELQGADVDFEFDTPLSVAYRRVKFEKALSANAYVKAWAEIGDDSAIDIIDTDAMHREALGAEIPQGWLRKDEQVQEIRGQKQRQAELREMAATAIEATKAGALPPAEPGSDPLAAMSGQPQRSPV